MPHTMNELIEKYQDGKVCYLPTQKWYSQSEYNKLLNKYFKCLDKLKKVSR